MPSRPRAVPGPQSLARRLKTLADPTRLGMVDHLVQGPSTVSELARHFGIAQPTASNHVKLLRDAGLVTDVRRRLPSASSPSTPPPSEDLLDHLRAVLEPGAATRPAPRSPLTARAPRPSRSDPRLAYFAFPLFHPFRAKAPCPGK